MNYFSCKHLIFTQISRNVFAARRGQRQFHEEHLLRSCLPSGCNKQQAALLYADKPIAVATDAHFASAAKPTAASL